MSTPRGSRARMSSLARWASSGGPASATSPESAPATFWSPMRSASRNSADVGASPTAKARATRGERPSMPSHEAAIATGSFDPASRCRAATASSTVAKRCRSMSRVSAGAVSAAGTPPTASISRSQRVRNSRKVNRLRTSSASHWPMRRSSRRMSRGTSRTSGVAWAFWRTWASWAFRFSRSLGVFLSTLA